MTSLRSLHPWLCLLAVACGDDGSSVGSAAGTTGSESPTTSGQSTASTTSSTDASSSSSSSGAETSDGSSTSSDESSSSTGAPPPDPLDWQDECVVSGLDLQTIYGGVQCTAIEVPLDWDDPQGETIPAPALRVRASGGARLGTFWLLDGGPGSSGLFLLRDEDLIGELTSAGWDVVIPPHRGTFSPRLDCPGLEPLSEACRDALENEWGDRLRHFNTRWAAHDVAALIERERASADEPVIVHGFSYGSFWAQVYTADFPQQASAFVLDSALPLDGDFASQENLVQDAALSLLQVCTDDPTCAGRVGHDSAESFFETVQSVVDEGECGIVDPGLWEDIIFTNTLGDLMNHEQARNFAPLVLAMLQTCDGPLSAQAFVAMVDLTSAVSAAPKPDFPRLGGNFQLDFSPVLQAVVMATTIARPTSDAAQEAEEARRHLISLGFAGYQRDAMAVWGTLPQVEIDREFEAEVPMLIFNGRYDMQTPFVWAQQVRAQHGATLVEFVDGRHGLALTGTGGKFPNGDSCARALMLAFAQEPAGELDVSCAAELPGLDTNLEREDLRALALEVFETEDPWSLLPPSESP